jgi:hypothetical protein
MPGKCLLSEAGKGPEATPTREARCPEPPREVGQPPYLVGEESTELAGNRL